MRQLWDGRKPRRRPENREGVTCRQEGIYSDSFMQSAGTAHSAAAQMSVACLGLVSSPLTTNATLVVCGMLMVAVPVGVQLTNTSLVARRTVKRYVMVIG
jgi:hypothetical protein